MPWKLHLDDRRRRLTVGSQTRRAPSIYSILNQAQQSESTIVGFRPLCCPNCGWDLPLRPDDTIFFCSSCARAWQIYGSDLTEVPYEIAQIEGMNGQSRYLPFWVLVAQSGGEHLTFYIPAFRFRRLKMLATWRLTSLETNRYTPSAAIRSRKLRKCKDASTMPKTRFCLHSLSKQASLLKPP